MKCAGFVCAPVLCRQVEALRLLYNEELARASKLAVQLSKATAAVDKVSRLTSPA